MAKDFYRLDEKHKKIILSKDLTKLTAEEEKLLQFYINAGYKITKKAENLYTKENMLKWLKKNAEEKIQEYESILKQPQGYIKARTWFCKIKKEKEK